MRNINPKNKAYAVKLLIALDLMELGIELKRQSIARAFPSDTEDLIDKKLQTWLNTPSKENMRL